MVSRRRLLKKIRKIRPTLDDVERLSKGKPSSSSASAGSRGVPHRLIPSERAAFEAGKRKGFVALRGTGWRKERGASPLSNIYRQYCDARGMPCVEYRAGIGFDPMECVSVDVSTLRVPQDMMETLRDVFDDVDSMVEESLLWIQRHDASLFCLQTGHALLLAEAVSDVTAEKQKGEEDGEVAVVDCTSSSSSTSTSRSNKSSNTTPVALGSFAINRGVVRGLALPRIGETERWCDRPIWDLPVTGISAIFEDRNDAKQFASIVAEIVGARGVGY